MTDAGTDARSATDAPAATDTPAATDAPVPVDAPTPPECTTAEDCDDGNTCSGDETCDADGNCVDGTALANGADCDADGMSTTRDICVENSCAGTRCGDGFADTTALEQCDDGNDVNGDGCDDCRFTCDDASDCADSETCNGDETCSAAHVCVPGTNLTNGVDCAGGTGRCVVGVCLPDSCTMPSDCSDGDVCTGEETCGASGCAAGTPLSCDDSNACTTDACVAGTVGCTHTLIDEDGDGYAATSLGECGMDCDDTRGDVGPDAAELCGNLRDDNCDGTVDEAAATTWYADCDADGYAASGARTLSSCAMPAPGLSMCTAGGGWTAREPADAASQDCNDRNATVNPAQTMYQTTDIPGAPDPSDFDYNCDGTESTRSSAAGSCAVASLTTCRTTQGWAAAVPMCGGMANWITGCTRTLAGCSSTTEMRTQACR